MITQQNDQIRKQSKILSERMRSGTGVNHLLHTGGSSTHYADSLQRFQKDFASFDHARRQQQRARKQAEIQKKRLQFLKRENERWEMMQEQDLIKKQRERAKIQQQNLGIKRTANSNSLPFNPINLAYHRNPQGQKLKLHDQDTKIRGFLRAHNIDHRGNSKYNPLNGGDRVGVESIIPTQLTERYEQKKNEHYENLKLHVPSTASSRSSLPRNNYS